MKNHKTVSVSAPGKLMLFGEHAVVFGYPCLVSAMDTRMRVSARLNGFDSDQIIAPQVKECKFVREAIKLFKEKYKIKRSFEVKTMGDFSHQVGLGSSSAVTTATFKALGVLFDKALSDKEIFDLSYSVTINIQGVGSGFDIAAATFGGILYFISGGKVIEPINSPNLPLVVGYSGIKADTPTLVRKVKAKYEKEERETVKIFENITDLVEQAKNALLRNNYPNLGQLMTHNHHLLQKLGVSTQKLDTMVENALGAGAYGAKLSGAGGGDCMIALVSNTKRKQVEEAIISAGGTIINVDNNAEGMRIE